MLPRTHTRRHERRCGLQTCWGLMGFTQVGFHFSHKDERGGGASPPCSRPRHSIRPHSQPRLWFASRPVVVSCFVGFDLQSLFTSQKCRHRGKQTQASGCHHSLWHRQTMRGSDLFGDTWFLPPPAVVCCSVFLILSLCSRQLHYDAVMFRSFFISSLRGATKWANKMTNNFQLHCSLKYGKKKDIYIRIINHLLSLSWSCWQLLLGLFIIFFLNPSAHLSGKKLSGVRERCCWERWENENKNTWLMASVWATFSC